MTKRILVVEDQEDLRAILRDFLTASGYGIEAQQFQRAVGLGDVAVAAGGTRLLLVPLHRERDRAK
jgi:CheY-like chemotaxis protein